MRRAKVLFKEEDAGILTQHDDGTYTFRYQDAWMANSNKPSICLTLPKTQQEFKSKNIFPFFFNMLPEGSNKQTICKYMRLDSDDYFGLLITSAKNDSIGAIRIIKIEQ